MFKTGQNDLIDLMTHYVWDRLTGADKVVTIRYAIDTKSFIITVPGKKKIHVYFFILCSYFFNVLNSRNHFEH